MVHKQIGQFLEVHDIDHEEVRSAAYLGYVRAYHTYKPQLGFQFTTWVWYHVNKRMLDALRKKITNDNRPVVQIDWDLFDQEEKLPEFIFDEWLETLSEDARLAAKVAVECPIDIKWFLSKLGEESPGNYRQAVREFLKELDWNDKRIKQSFQEIKERL